MRGGLLSTVIAAFVALILQIILAPNIVIISAMPNFVLIYLLVITLLRSADNVLLILAFILGLSYDLLGHAPVGVMAFLFVLASFALSRLFPLLNNDTLFMPLALIFTSILIVEFAYAAFMLGFGMSASFMDVFVLHALPCVLYNCVFGLILYPLALRFFARRSAQSLSAHGQKTAQTSFAAQVQLHAPKSKKRRR